GSVVVGQIASGVGDGVGKRVEKALGKVGPLAQGAKAVAGAGFETSTNVLMGQDPASDFFAHLAEGAAERYADDRRDEKGAARQDEKVKAIAARKAKTVEKRLEARRDEDTEELLDELRR